MSTTPLNRRAALRTMAGLACGAACIDASAELAAPGTATPPSRTWDWLATQYDVAGDIINLENGYYGIMSRPVLAEYKRNIDYLNLHSSPYMRQDFDEAGGEAIRARLAQHAGVDVEEVAITRNATESLQNLIANYRLVKAGDTVMYGNLDYPSMQSAMNDLAQRRGAQVAIVDLPEPASRQNILDTYEQALARNPRTRLLLLTHISHRTGLILPVVDIIRMAKARHVDVIVDVAQSWGQRDFHIPDLGADFVGANLHKWIGAPLGTGFLYIRKSRLDAIGVQLGNREYPATDIRARVLSGTGNAAAVMTIPAALAFHGQVSLAERSARLRAARDYWVHQVAAYRNVQILTPDDADMSGAVTSFRLRGHTTFAANVALTRRLVDEFGIFTVARDGPVGGSCIRVTPSYFTRTDQLDRLVAAIGVLARTG